MVKCNIYQYANYRPLYKRKRCPPWLKTIIPTGNLDSKTSKQVLYRMLELTKNQQVTFVMVTHEPELAECADRVVTILDGKVCSNVVQDEATKTRNREGLFADLQGDMSIGGDAAKEKSN